MGMKIDLAGRVAFVTGASSGLGAQFARTLAASSGSRPCAPRSRPPVVTRTSWNWT